jgi:hypothetical protein
MTSYYNYKKSILFHIRNHTKDYIQFMLTQHHQLGYTDVIIETMNILSEELSHDIIKILSSAYGKPVQEVFQDSEESPILYKQNKYNLTLVTKMFKVKVWLGLQSYVAKTNSTLAREHFSFHYHDNFFVNELRTEKYFIECYKLVRGVSCENLIKKHDGDALDGYVWYNSNDRDILSKNSIIEYFDQISTYGDDTMTVVIDLFFNFVIEIIHNKTSRLNAVYYPSDCNFGNFIIDCDSEYKFPNNLVLIDYDHMCIDRPDQMIHNVSWQFFSRIFDLQNLPDKDTTPEFAEWRKNHDLFEEVEKFKIKYSEVCGIEYDSDKQCFEYGVYPATLNNSEYLIDYVETKKTEKTMKEKFTDD